MPQPTREQTDQATKRPWKLKFKEEWPFDIRIICGEFQMILGRVAYNTKQESIEDVRNAVGFTYDREETKKQVAEQEANARLIVQAVNNHDKLRYTLDTVKRAIVGYEELKNYVAIIDQALKSCNESGG